LSNTSVTMRDMLDAGAHYGHQCRRWNPKMKRYIFGSRNGIHILDLQKTVRCLKSAVNFTENIVTNGGHVLFVGTKRQAREVVCEEAKRCNMFFANFRWLGGTLTNYQTIRQSIHRLKKIEKMSTDGTYEKLNKKERLELDRIKEKLELNLGGIKDMHGLPQAVFITDAHKEHIAVSEAKKLGIPIIAITDSNSDPELIDYPIPANDDSLKSLQLFTKAIADSCLSGLEKRKFKVNEELSDNKSKEGTIYDQSGHSVKVTKKKK
jgi:small subunit ribosomal protein S2